MKKVLAIFVSVLFLASLSLAAVGCSKEEPKQEAAPAVEAPATPAEPAVAPAETPAAPAAEAPAPAPAK